MFCPNCGVELQEGSKFCVECGTPLRNDAAVPIEETPTFGTLRIKRGRHGSGTAIPVEVFIDGESAGKVKYSSEIEVVQVSGPHEVVFEMSNKTIGKASVNVLPNSIAVCEFDPPLVGSSATIKSTYYLGNTAIEVVPSRSVDMASPQSGRCCVKCGAPVTVQAVSEVKPAGCLATIFYIALALTVFGIPIVLIILLARKKSQTKTYAVCSRCGHKQLLRS